MDNEPPYPINKLTIPGRLLLAGTIMMFAGGVYFYFFHFIDILPAGNYPFLMFVLPVALSCFFFFLGAAWIPGRCGVGIYRR
jgi:hypothetical protein